MGSPFGLAYGLGAGLAAGPVQAYYKGQDDAMARGLKELEAAEYRRKVAEQQSLNEALSQPLAAQQPTTITTPGVTQEQYDEMVSHDVPEGEEGPSQAYGQQVSKKIQVTPFETEAGKRAAMLKQAAEMQRSRGFGLSSQQLMTQAGQAEKEHQAASALELIRASKFGDTGRMMSALHALGAVNAQSVRPGEDGGIILTAGDGQEVELDKEDLQSIATGSSPADVFRQKAAITQRNVLEQKRVQAEINSAANEQKYKYNKELITQRGFNSLQLQQARLQWKKDNPNSDPTALQKNAHMIAQNYMDTEHAAGRVVSAEEALQYGIEVTNHLNRGDVTNRDQYNAADRDVKAYVKDNPSASRPGDKNYPTYIDLVRKRDAFAPAGGRRSRGGEPQSAPPSSGPKKFRVVIGKNGQIISSNDPKQRVGQFAKSANGGTMASGTYDYDNN